MNPGSKGTIPVNDIPGFWNRLSSARHSFLSLDYDGTIAPFETDRMAAFPLPGIAELLAKIRDKTGNAVALISGRPASQVVELFGDRGIMIVGSHGYEFRYPDGCLARKEPTPRQTAGLDAAWKACIGEGVGSRAEVKPAGIAMHTRGLPGDEAQNMEARIMEHWWHIAPGHELEVRRFDGGVELRCKGMNKGDALRTLLTLVKEGAFAVYLGDDETDEDAFDAIRDRGIGIKVGHEGEPTRATGFLPDVQSVSCFLEDWLHHAPYGQTGEISWNHADWR
ncbi:MAG: trehalose-phosphatase [Syntrophaceae bacterium]|nr:trehalose-phosphatase [Deltaproteobacteria bacterium]